jgi:hypothetical protein
MSQQILAYLEDISKNLPSVTSIRLVYKKLGPIEAGLIANALKKNTHVTMLRLDCNNLGDRGEYLWRLQINVVMFG